MSDYSRQVPPPPHRPLALSTPLNISSPPGVKVPACVPRNAVVCRCRLFTILPPSQVAVAGMGFGGDAVAVGGAGLRHLRVTDAIRRFACPLCPYKTARKDLLEGHVRTHTGDKPFSCPHCPYQSADRSNLRRHRLKNHIGITNVGLTQQQHQQEQQQAPLTHPLWQ